jgi:hypothetical protein
MNSCNHDHQTYQNAPLEWTGGQRSTTAKESPYRRCMYQTVEQRFHDSQRCLCIIRLVTTRSTLNCLMPPLCRCACCSFPPTISSPRDWRQVWDFIGEHSQTPCPQFVVVNSIPHPSPSLTHSRSLALYLPLLW